MKGYFGLLLLSVLSLESYSCFFEYVVLAHWVVDIVDAHCGDSGFCCLLLKRVDFQLVCVFLDFGFVYLASINHRAKLTAKVIYNPSAVQLLQASEKSYHKPSNQSWVHSPNHLFYVTVTHQANISPALRQLEITSITQSLTTLFKPASPKLFSLACLVSPVGNTRKALGQALALLQSTDQTSAPPVAPHGVGFTFPLLWGEV